MNTVFLQQFYASAYQNENCEFYNIIKIIYSPCRIPVFRRTSFAAQYVNYKQKPPAVSLSSDNGNCGFTDFEPDPC
jgi:hypothetical protein